MGNAQSTSHRGHDGAVVLQDPDRSLSDLCIPIPVGGYRSTPELRNELRDKIFSSGSVREVGSRETLDDGPPTGGRDAREALLSQDAVARVLSSKDGQHLDISTLAAILQELKKTASPEELVMLRQALLPGMDSEISLSGQRSRKAAHSISVRGFAERQKSVNGPSPGTATRSKITRLKKQPTKKRTRSPEGSRPKTWAVEDFRASPLSHLAGLNSPNPMLRSSMPPHRPATPQDLECVNLGNLRPGTLRVTNGAVTPEPSIRSGRVPFLAALSPLAQDDYFTCSEGTDEEIGCSPGNVLTDDSKSTISLEGSPTTPTLNPRLHSFELSRKPEQTISPSQIGSRKAVQRFVFDDAHSEVLNDDDEPLAFTVYSKEASANPFVTGETDMDDPQESSILNSSPFDTPMKPTRAPPAPPEPQSNSVPVRMPSSESEHVTNGDDIGASATGNQQSAIPQDICMPQIGEQRDRYYSKGPSTHMDPHTSPGRQLQPQPTEAPLSDARGYGPRAPALALSLDTSGFHTPLAVQEVRSPQTARPVAAPVLQYERTIHSAGNNAIEVEQPVHHFPTEADSSPRCKSAADILNDFESPAIPLEGTMSLPTSAEKTRKRNRLQKKRFSKQDVRDTIAVETSGQSPVQNVPSVPVHLAANLEQRMKDFKPLDHTFDSVSTVEVRSTTSDQFPKGPEIRFPSPPQDAEASPSSGRGRRSRRSSIGPGTSPSRLFRGLSRRASKERKVSDPYEVIDGEIMGVKDFGAVPDFAGASPYDVISKATKRPQSEDLSSRPRAVLSKPAKARHIQGMDDKTASEFAKARSRDLLVSAEGTTSTISTSARNSPPKRGHIERPPLQSYSTESQVPPLPQARQKGARPQTIGGTSIRELSGDASSPPNDIAGGARLLWKSAGPVPSEGGGISGPHTKSDAATPAPLRGEVLGAWEAQAEFWRSRRDANYHGDYVARSHYDDPVKEDLAKGLKDECAPTEAQSPADKFPKRHTGAPLQRLTSTLHAPTRFEAPRAGARSPSPSVKERAAFFERTEAEATGRSRTPSPTRMRPGGQAAGTLVSSYAANQQSAAQTSGGASGWGGMRAALRDLS